MSRYHDRESFKKNIILLLVLLNATILKVAFIDDDKWYGLLWLTVPLLGVAIIYKTNKLKMIKSSLIKARLVSPRQERKAKTLQQSIPTPILSSNN